MKRIIYLSIMLFAFAACKKVTTDNVSKIITLPTIKILGNKFTSIPVGGTYADAGAEVTLDGGVKKNVASTDVVDVNTAGLYPVKYTFTDELGNTVNDWRYVGVTNVPAAQDLSGVYTRTSNGVTMNVKEEANGLYSSDNIAGSTLVVFACFVQIDDSTISLPAQPTLNVDEIDFTNQSIVQTPPTDVTLAWKVVNGAFGPALRTFTRN